MTLRARLIEQDDPQIGDEIIEVTHEDGRTERLRLQLSAVRRPKDAVELERMRAAQRATRAAFAHVAEFLADGVTERQAQIELDLLQPPIEPVQVRLQEHQRAPVEAQALPDAVAQDEAGVEDRHLRLPPRHERAVEIDLQVRVARIDREILTSSHGPSFYLAT